MSARLFSARVKLIDSFLRREESLKKRLREGQISCDQYNLLIDQLYDETIEGAHAADEKGAKRAIEDGWGR